MKLFRENGQLIALVISLIVAVVLLSGQIGRLEERLTDRIDGVEQRLTDRIDRVEARIDRVEARIGRVDARIGRLEDRLHSIEIFLRGGRAEGGG